MLAWKYAQEDEMCLKDQHWCDWGIIQERLECSETVWNAVTWNQSNKLWNPKVEIYCLELTEEKVGRGLIPGSIQR